jgi:selenium donor protein
MPMVDDPYDFGRIAATNAISDVYAMSGTPIMALALVGMPINVLSIETIGKILEGGASVCRSAGIPIAGGHSIDSVEPIYGLVALGLVHPTRIKRNASARVGDRLILGKPLGVGILSAELKKGTLDAPSYARLIALTTQPTHQARIWQPWKEYSTEPACRCWTAFAPETVNAVMAIFTHHGFVGAVDIGEITTQTGEPKLVVN